MNRPTKILFCSVLAVISFLCLGAVFTAPPPFWRNAWSTNQPPRAVTGVNNLTVSNFNSTTGWQFWAVGPKTVARLGDVSNVVSSSGAFIATQNGLGNNTTLVNPTNNGQLTYISDAALMSAVDSIDGLLKLLFFFTDGDIILGNGTNMNSVVMRVLGPAGSTDLNYAGTDFYPGTSLTTLGATVPFGSVTSTGAVTVTKGSFFGNGSGVTNLGNANNVNFQPSKSALSNLVGTVGNNVTNFVSLSTSNATSQPLTNSYSAGVLTMFGLERGANITLTPNASNIVIAATASGGLTTNANQFLGAPLSLKDGVQVTNLTNSGVLTGAIGVFTQETNSGNLTMTAVTPSIIDGFGMTRVTIPKNTSITLRGTNGSITFLVDKDGKGVTIGTNLSLGSTPVAKLEILSDPTLYQIRVCTNNFVVTNFLVGIGTAVPLSKLHVTNSTAQTNVRIDQQNTTNPIVQFYNNNTLTSEFTTNGFSTFTSNLLAPTGITAPATTVKWTNPIPENIEVYIDNSGVTGTAIQKNGTTIFTSLVGDVTIGLQRGEFIALTYSVGTPSIKWSPR